MRPFPAGWNFYSSYPTSPTPSIPHGAVAQIAIRFVAVDTDGFLVSGDTDEGAAKVPAQVLRDQAGRTGSMIGIPAADPRK
jgi:hypothetical protein